MDEEMMFKIDLDGHVIDFITREIKLEDPTIEFNIKQIKEILEKINKEYELYCNTNKNSIFYFSNSIYEIEYYKKLFEKLLEVMKDNHINPIVDCVNEIIQAEIDRSHYNFNLFHKLILSNESVNHFGITNDYNLHIKT